MGKVYLVGAGPGNVEYLTLRAQELLTQAEVLIYDALVDDQLLSLVPPKCIRFDVGKRGGRPSASQAEINRLLVEQCKQGKQVVRLKGGDPFIFGRATSEILALQEAGCPFEVVPGISSALAAPLFAGIPLTDTVLSRCFAVVSAHEPDELDWEALARLETLVILMGGRHLEKIVKQLQRYGRSLASPVAVIRACGTPQQQVWSGTLKDIVKQTAGASLSPVVIVIGEVVGLRDYLRSPSEPDVRSPIVRDRKPSARSSQADVSREELQVEGSEEFNVEALPVVDSPEVNLEPLPHETSEAVNVEALPILDTQEVNLETLPIETSDEVNLETLPVVDSPEVNLETLLNETSDEASVETLPVTDSPEVNLETLPSETSDEVNVETLPVADSPEANLETLPSETSDEVNVENTQNEDSQDNLPPLNLPPINIPPYNPPPINLQPSNLPPINLQPVPQTLAGKTILVTRSAGQSSQFTRLLQEEGAEVIEMPALVITPPSSWVQLDNAIANLYEYDWLILTSANGVDYFFERLYQQGRNLRALASIKIAVVGKKTAASLKAQGLTANYIPPDYVADSLVENFPEPLEGRTVLFPRVESGGRDVLVKQLTARGAEVTEVAAYESGCPDAIAPDALEALQQQRVDVITFASSKTVKHFYQLLERSLPESTLSQLENVCIASIGPQTSMTCRQLLGRVDIEPEEYTLEGLTQAIVLWATDKSRANTSQ